MSSEEKKESSSSAQQPKLQRKLKFKTLDGNIKNLECDYDIKISELKKKLAEIYNIEPARQRLLNKGKQFKDEETLDKLVDKDDTIIHLVFRSEEDVRNAQQNAANNENNNNNNANQNANTNPFANIFNSEEIRNLTSNIANNIVSRIFSPPNNSNNSNINVPTNTNRINIGNTQITTVNVGETLNLTNSPLHPIATPHNLTTPPLNLNNNSNTNANNETNADNVIPSNKNNYSSQFPITSSNTDKKYEMHLKNIEKELNNADELISQKMEPRIPLPLLNTTQNVFTAISRSIRKYVIVNQNILCHLMFLADLMEREQFISNRETRMNGNKLLDQAYKALSHISKASNDLSNVIKSSNFNTAPNTGYIGIICQEVGLQSTAIPISIDSPDFNANNILSSLTGANNSGNSNNINNNLGNIVVSNINLNNNNINNGTQPQGSIGGIAAEIPINIVQVTIDQSSHENNIAANTNNNATNNNVPPPATTTVNNAQNENSNNIPPKKENDKKEEPKKENEDKKEKEKEVKKEDNKNIPNKAEDNKANDENKNSNKNENTKTPTDNNTTSTANQNNQNNVRNTNQNNNDFNNFFGNMMNQLMTPQNLNSLAGAVGSMLNNQGNNGQGNAGGNNMGGIFGNLFSNLMSSFDNENDEDDDFDEPSPIQQNTPPKPKEEFITPKENTDNTNNKNANAKNISLIKKLADSPYLRRDTKLNDESKIGEKIEPNVEFSSFSNEIISDLTVQDVYHMFNLHFTGLSRLRREIQKKFFSEKSKKEEIIKKVVELLCERFILVENQIDKLNPNKEFNIEEFFNNHLKGLLNMFIADEEINKTDSQWEDTFRELVINMFSSLIKELKEVYETGEDGAKTFIEFNMMTLIENLVGQKYLGSIQSYDENIINKFVENVVTIVKTQEIKNKCKEKSEETNGDNNIELLSINDIFKIATKDKERLEKEKEEGPEKKMEKFSDFYYQTSLFKNN